MGIEIRTALAFRSGEVESRTVELVIGGVIFKTDAPSFEAALRIVQTTTAALNIGEPGLPNYGEGALEETRPGYTPVPKSAPTEVVAAPPACSECGWYLGHDLECPKGPFKFAKPFGCSSDCRAAGCGGGCSQ